jgi:hypothetical protein
MLIVILSGRMKKEPSPTKHQRPKKKILPKLKGLSTERSTK